jgi:hypothetical protein
MRSTALRRCRYSLDTRVSRPSPRLSAKGTRRIAWTHYDWPSDCRARPDAAPGLGLSQLQLAAGAGLSLTTIFMMERVGAVPRPAILTRLASTLGVPLADLQRPASGDGGNGKGATA